MPGCHSKGKQWFCWQLISSNTSQCEWSHETENKTKINMFSFFYLIIHGLRVVAILHKKKKKAYLVKSPKITIIFCSIILFLSFPTTTITYQTFVLVV